MIQESSRNPSGGMNQERLAERVQTRVRAAGRDEIQSLRSVYSEMRGIYRRYRRQTGSRSIPELRDAVRAFRRGPSLPCLVNIATFLDDRNLLAW
jgi:hypothetical protein